MFLAALEKWKLYIFYILDYWNKKKCFLSWVNLLLVRYWVLFCLKKVFQRIENMPYIWFKVFESIAGIDSSILTNENWIPWNDSIAKGFETQLSGWLDSQEQKV